MFLRVRKSWLIRCTVGVCLFFAVISASAGEPRSEQRVHRLSDDLEIREILPDAFVVTHWFPWGGNSLVVLIGESDAVFVDTPYTPEATEVVLDWIAERFGDRSFVEVNTGYHVDNLGGNQALVSRGIPILGSDKTASLLRARGEATRELTVNWLQDAENKSYRERHATIEYVEPTHLFRLPEGHELIVANELVQVTFPGETHAPDNVVVYFPERKLLFGGCMIRAGSGLGNTADANMESRKSAIEQLRVLECVAVVPGHGIRFDPGVIDNTISMLR